MSSASCALDMATANAEPGVTVGAEQPLTRPVTAKMRLWAIGDIHLSFKSNREEWAKLKHKREDGLILAGDGTFASAPCLADG